MLLRVARATTTWCWSTVVRQTVVRELSWSQLSLCGTAQRLRECAQPCEARRDLRANWSSVRNETSNLRELVCSCQLAWTVVLAPLRCQRHWCHVAHVGSKKHHLSSRCFKARCSAFGSSRQGSPFFRPFVTSWRLVFSTYQAFFTDHSRKCRHCLRNVQCPIRFFPVAAARLLAQLVDKQSAL